MSNTKTMRNVRVVTSIYATDYVSVTRCEDPIVQPM